MKKQIPHDQEAERALLGAILLDNQCLADVSDVSEADFFDFKHQAIWRALHSLARRGQPFDEVTLERELRAHGRYESVGGLSYFAELAIRVPTSGNVTHYATIVRERAQARRLLQGFGELVQSAYQGVGAEDLAANARKHLREIATESAGFASAAKRIEGEAQRRQRLVARELRFNVAFLDDYLRGILPHDLIVIGARTGAGKTQLAQIIATSNAAVGRHVYLFALEAEPDEIERRTKFAGLAACAHHAQVAGRERLNYPDWYRGRCDDIVGPLEAEAEAWVQRQLATLYTLYRGTNFDVDDIVSHVMAIRDTADLIILDHLHYVDSDDPNENRAVRTICKRLRDLSLAIGVPVVVVAHLRKKDRRHKQVVPDLDDFHGSSDITKIATAVILLARANRESDMPWIANTYLQIPKSRQGGGCTLVGIQGFDFRRNTYENVYQLGRLNLAGDEVQPLRHDDYPRWAKRSVASR